jgi:ATP-dependent Clp protease ATP-binding subunit ClpA
MMSERFSRDARTVVVLAQQHARRLGHRYIGCEHLLLAIVATDQQAAAVLREHGVTPERVEEEIVRRVGLGPGPACSATSTGTHWPPSGSISTPSVPGSRCPSDRKP